MLLDWWNIYYMHAYMCIYMTATMKAINIVCYMNIKNILIKTYQKLPTGKDRISNVTMLSIKIRKRLMWIIHLKKAMSNNLSPKKHFEHFDIYK